MTYHQEHPSRVAIAIGLGGIGVAALAQLTPEHGKPETEGAKAHGDL